MALSLAAVVEFVIFPLISQVLGMVFFFFAIKAKKDSLYIEAGLEDSAFYCLFILAILMVVVALVGLATMNTQKKGLAITVYDFVYF